MSATTATCFDLINNRKFSDLNQYECEGYLVKLHLMYHCMVSMGNNESLNELKSLLSRYHRNIDSILPYIHLDFNALSQQILETDYSEPRNKSELHLQKEFENGTPSQRVLMIFEEIYHFSKGSKVKLYFGTRKFFLCRYQSYQDSIRLIVIILFYIPSLPLTPNEIMDVVLSHCKNRLEFTANIFRNVPLSILKQLTKQLVEYTEKQINLIKKARVSNHQKRIESTGKQIEIMKRIFRNLASFSPLIAGHIQNVIASKQICPEIYIELSLSLQENSPNLFIQQFSKNLTNLNQQQYLLPYLKSINNNHQMVKKMNSFLQKTINEYNRLKSQLKHVKKWNDNDKLEMDADEDEDDDDDDDEDVDMKDDNKMNKNDEITEEYIEIIDTMEQLITIYVTFVGLVSNIEIDVNAISGLLSIITDDAPYRLLSPLMIFIVLCPRFVKMKRFETVCSVYYNHPILDIDYFMMIHYILQDTYQPILDSLKNYTKVPLLNVNANTFHHFKELKQAFIHSNIINNSNYIDLFFISTKSKLLNYDKIKIHLNKMKIMNGNQKLDCSTLYLYKLQRFLITAQFILQKDLFNPNIMKMDEWLFNVITAVCWPPQTVQSGFPSTCFTMFKLMDRCAMLTSRMHLEAAVSSNNGNINKNGVEAFYNYIESELEKHNGCKSINCYSNPLQISLCVYFILLSNHRFYKSYNHHSYSNGNGNGNGNGNINGNGNGNGNMNGNGNGNNNNNIDSFMSDGSDILMSSNNNNNDDLLPATNSFHKASQFYKVTPINIDKDPPFPIDILYSLPVTGCIQYLRLKTSNDDIKGKESIDKSIEKCIYLIRHHYPHLLYWLDLNSLLVSPKFEFLQYGLNLDLMRDQLYFNQSYIKNNIKEIHESFIKDFVNNYKEWTNNISFDVPQSFYSLITIKDIAPTINIHLLPSTLSFDDLSKILKAMAASFQHNDLIHHKWQYMFCFWWHKYSMYQPLSFICLSLKVFITNTNANKMNNIRNVFLNPNILLEIDSNKYPSIWSNIWFLHIYVRIIHVLLTASQEYILSSHPNIYSTLANENLRNNEKVKDDKTCKQLRSLIILNEINILENIMINIEESDNWCIETMEIVIELLLWRHCQSLSQGNCYESSITRNDNSDNLHLKSSFDHKNFKSFRNFVIKYHEKFGFDIISLLLYRTISYSYIPILINKLITQHNNNWNILHQYQSIIMKHFELFSHKLLSSDCNKAACIKYFESISDIKQSWLFAIIFVLESVSLTDDEVWINCFKFIMQEIGDIIHQLSHYIVDIDIYYIKNDKIRRYLINVLDGLWLKVKDSKYMMDAFMLKQLSLLIANPIKRSIESVNNGLNGTNWPYIDTKSIDI